MTALAADVTVVGAGFTGMALAYGLARRGARVTLLDARDPLGELLPSVAPMLAQQASLGGVSAVHLTRLAVNSWTDCDAELTDIAGCHSQFRRDGGLFLCRDEDALSARAADVQGAQKRGASAVEMLDAAALGRLVPHLGRDIAGASYCADDARISPHALRRALALALVRLGVDYRAHCRVQWVREQGGEWVVMAQGLAVGCGRVALACGLDSVALVPTSLAPPELSSRPASVVQLQALLPFMPFACAQFSQAGDGSVHLDTRGLEDGVCDSAEVIRARAASFYGGLGQLRVVRSWHGDAIASAGGTPCYQPLDTDARCWLVAAPDPIFMVPVHAGLVADAVAGRVPPHALVAFQQSSDAAVNPSLASGKRGCK